MHDTPMHTDGSNVFEIFLQKYKFSALKKVSLIS